MTTPDPMRPRLADDERRELSEAIERACIRELAAMRAGVGVAEASAEVDALTARWEALQ